MLFNRHLVLLSHPRIALSHSMAALASGTGEVTLSTAAPRWAAFFIVGLILALVGLLIILITFMSR